MAMFQISGSISPNQEKWISSPSRTNNMRELSHFQGKNEKKTEKIQSNCSCSSEVFEAMIGSMSFLDKDILPIEFSLLRKIVGLQHSAKPIS